jgi:hypothetical protein
VSSLPAFDPVRGKTRRRGHYGVNADVVGDAYIAGHRQGVSRLIPPLFCSRDHDRRGAVAILFAVVLVAIIGFVSLGTEIVLLLSTSRHMQSAADAGAFGAVSARIRGYPADYKQEALAMAADAGFTNSVGGTIVDAHSPPLTGSYAGKADAVEVLISQPQTLALAKVVYSGSFIVRARSVAHTNGNGSCALALDPAASGSFSMNGGTVADFAGCDLSVNSTSAQAVLLVGGAIVNAGHLNDAGGYTLSGGAKINATITSPAPATSDPYADRIMPAAATACIADPNVKKNMAISPGTYCSITVSAANLNLAAGTYIIKGGTLTVKGGGTLSGTGVTIVLTGFGGNYATVSIGSNSTITLTAPSSGATAGMVFFQDRDAPTSGTNTFGGGPTQSITGALYFPNQTVEFGGGSATTITCIEIVAWRVRITGNATLTVTDCAGTGVLAIGGGQAAMVE